MPSSQRPTKLQLYLGLMRPRTLLAGASSVLVAIAYAYATLPEVSLLKVLLLLLVALSAQASSNVVNDLLDFQQGADTPDRQGPLRPLSQGLLSPREVYATLCLTLAVLVLAGGILLALSSWVLLGVGLAILLALYAYSGGPYPLAYHGLGDVAVLIFFGWVPVVTSYYILGGAITDTTLWHLATAIGLASVNILVVNNYRDATEDAKSGKRTLIVRMGRDFAPRLYLTCGLLSLGLLYPIYSFWGMLCMLPYVLLFSATHRELQQHEGKELNSVLAHTARNVVLLALLIALMLLLR